MLERRTLIHRFQGQPALGCVPWMSAGMAPPWLAVVRTAPSASYRIKGKGKDHVLQGHQGEVHDVAVSPNNGLLASAGADCTVRFWKLNSGRHITSF